MTDILISILNMSHVYVETQGEYDYYMETYDYYREELQSSYSEPEREKILEMLETERDYAILEPGETDISEYSNLFDGWDRPSGTHQAEFIISCIMSVTFEDKTVWSNPDYADWVLKYKDKAISISSLENYYRTDK